MLAAQKPKLKVSFLEFAPLLATIEDPMDFWGGKSGQKKKKHHRGQSIANLVKIMLMGEGGSAEGGNNDGIKDKKNNKLSDFHGSDNLCNRNDVEGSEDFSTNPVHNLPDQLATEQALSASIAPSGNSSLVDVDDMSSINGKDCVALVPTMHQEELRCVITISHHGDRTPKQKLKGEISCIHYAFSRLCPKISYATITSCIFASSGDINGEHFLQYYHDHLKKVKKDLKVKVKKEMVYVQWNHFRILYLNVSFKLTHFCFLTNIQFNPTFA
jgi:hypothetical protein